MTTWTKPVLFKDEMVLSQYAIADCTSRKIIDKYIITCTRKSNANDGTERHFKDPKSWEIPPDEYDRQKIMNKDTSVYPFLTGHTTTLHELSVTEHYTQIASV